MASPFTVFRRNQKVLLAVTGISAMIAFVFLGTCVQSPGPVQGYENPTVVSWKYGDITEADMADRIGMRRILNHFLLSARVAAGIPVNQNETIFPESEDSVVRSMVLARRGRELGLVISDEMVNRVLAQLTNNRVPPAELEQIIANVRPDGRVRMTPKQIFDALREELLARHVAMLFLDGLGAEGQVGVPPLDTPAQRWDNFRRLERQATVQVLPVPVAEFTEEVGKPDEDDLRALFEKYKDQFPSPNSPDPGFRLPYRARFEFFKADAEELITAEMKLIPAEEVSEYYEKNKDTQFRKTKLTPFDDEPGREEAGKEDSSKEVTTDEGQEKKTDATESDVEEKSDKPSTDDVKDQSTKDSEESKESEKTAPAEEKPPVKSDSGSAPTEKSSQTMRSSPFQLVSYQDDAEKKDEPKEVKEAVDEPKAKPAPETAQEKPSPAPNSEGDKEDDSKKAATTEGSDAAKAGAKEDVPNASADTTEGAKSADDKSADAEAEPVEYRPLEEVEEDIRRTLARERVQKVVEERFSAVRTELNRYAKLRLRWERDVTKNPDEPKPKPLDLDALAEKHGLQLFKTALISRIDAAGNSDLEIAQSYDFSAGTPGRPFAQWTDVAFEKGNLYRPRTSDALAGNRFLWWKIEEKQGQVSSFSDAREQVLETWKHIQARDRAKRQAEQYAKTVRQARQPMKEVFAQDKDLPVSEVGPFSWLTRPNVPLGMMQQLPPVQYPEIAGVLNPSEEFMKTTFHLESGDVGVAFNHPKSIVYVIQPASFTPSDAVLEQEFMVRMRDYERYRAAGSIALVEAQEGWMDSLFNEYGVQWHRTADLRNATFE